jgi:hypothetical protein
MPALLTSFTIARNGEDYIVRIGTQDGANHEIVATFEQLDLLAEEIDRQLDSDEESDLASGPFIGANDPD